MLVFCYKLKSRFEKLNRKVQMRQVWNVQSFVFILPAVLISLFMHSNEVLESLFIIEVVDSILSTAWMSIFFFICSRSCSLLSVQSDELSFLNHGRIGSQCFMPWIFYFLEKLKYIYRDFCGCFACLFALFILHTFSLRRKILHNIFMVCCSFEIVMHMEYTECGTHLCQWDKVYFSTFPCDYLFFAKKKAKSDSVWYVYRTNVIPNASWTKMCKMRIKTAVK